METIEFIISYISSGAFQLGFAVFLATLTLRWWKKPSKTFHDVFLAFLLGVSIVVIMNMVQWPDRIDFSGLKEGDKFLLTFLAFTFSLITAIAVKIARDAVDDVHKAKDALKEEIKVQTQTAVEITRDAVDAIHKAKDEIKEIKTQTQTAVEITRSAVDDIHKAKDELKEEIKAQTQTAVEITRNAVDNIHKAKDELKEEIKAQTQAAEQERFTLQRMHLYLGALNDLTDARYKQFELGEQASPSDVLALETLVLFYETADETWLPDRLQKLATHHEARAKITKEGWNYIRQIEEIHKGKREDIAQPARELLRLRKV